MPKKIISHIVGSEPLRPSFVRRLGVAANARLRGFDVFTVPNQSMSPTLRIRDIVPLDGAAYSAASIERGDVVVYRSQKHEGLLLPSRVVGLPGETIELRRSRLTVDGKEIAECYLEADAAKQPHSRDHGPTVVPTDCVFLLGDFRDLSEDSRIIGPVKIQLLVGRVVV
jgi:signal peptidase I